MANCVACGAPLKPKKQFCIKCGTPVAKTVNQQTAPARVGVPCGHCGALVPVNKSFCTACGKAMAAKAIGNCAVCGSPLKPNKSFCIKCGSPVSKAAKVQLPLEKARNCPHCGANVPVQKRFCAACGKAMETKAAFPVPLPAARWLALVTVLAIGVVGVGGYAIYKFIIYRSDFSADQRLLANVYGNPPYFSLTFDQEKNQNSKVIRREVWIYPEKKASFVFLNGAYKFSSEVRPLEPNMSQASALRASEISEALTAEELAKMAGQPLRTVNVSQDTLPDAVWYEFSNGVNALFSQGRLLLLQTAPKRQGK